MHAAPSPGADAPVAPPTRAAVAGWVTYDLANTIFSLLIVSLEFPLWVVGVVEASGQPATRGDAVLGWANGLSMVAVALTAPILGAVSDSARRRMPFLVASTVGCVAATALIGRGGLLPSLVLFGIANALYNLGLVFYDSLLPEVSTPATRGRIGGLGVAVGYLGSVVGIAAAALLAARMPGDYRPTLFLATAVLFLLLSIPCFVFVKERARVRLPRAPVVATVKRTLRDLKGYPALRRFLIGRVFYADGANTLIIFMGVYVSRELGFSDSAVRLLLLGGIAGAILGGYVFGALADRRGPKRALYVVLWLWLVVFALAIAVPVLGLPRDLFWPVAALAGLCLGGTWATDRPFMLRLTPPTRVGEFYGLYATVGRFAAIMGPILWGLIVDTLGLGRPAAIAALMGLMVLAMWLLRHVPDDPVVERASVEAQQA